MAPRGAPGGESADATGPFRNAAEPGRGCRQPGGTPSPNPTGSARSSAASASQAMEPCATSTRRWTGSVGALVSTRPAARCTTDGNRTVGFSGPATTVLEKLAEWLQAEGSDSFAMESTHV